MTPPITEDLRRIAGIKGLSDVEIRLLVLIRAGYVDGRCLVSTDQLASDLGVHPHDLGTYLWRLRGKGLIGNAPNKGTVLTLESAKLMEEKYCNPL